MSKKETKRKCIVCSAPIGDEEFRYSCCSKACARFLVLFGAVVQLEEQIGSLLRMVAALNSEEGK